MWNGRVTLTVVAAVALLVALCALVGAVYAPDYADRRGTLLTLGAEHTLSSGRRQQYINALRGSGGVESFEWVVVGAPGSTVTLTVGSPHSGVTSQSITLRAR